MKIRALANGNVIEAHEDAAKILIENKIYEKVSDNEKLGNNILGAPNVLAWGGDK